MIGQSYHWRGFSAQLSPWQQEREVERSACVGGGGELRWAGLPFLVTVGRLGYSAGPPASQEHKWSCVNSLCWWEPDPSQPPPFNATDISLFPRVVSLLLWKVDSSEAADYLVLNSTLTQNNYYWISFCHFIIKLPVNFHLCFELFKYDTVILTLRLLCLTRLHLFYHKCTKMGILLNVTIWKTVFYFNIFKM